MFSKCVSLKKCVVQESGPCALSHTRADLVGRDTDELAEGISAGELTPTAIRRVGPAPSLGTTIRLALVV